MVLIELIHALESFDPLLPVRTDRHEYLYPTQFSSYRGYYRDLALNCEGPMVYSWAARSDVPYEAPKVRYVKWLCEDTIDRTFQGYKGGDFTMGEYTNVWIASGDHDHTSIIPIDFVMENGMVVIKTAYIGDYA